ncbi:hypothetical protein F443_22847 [Phytophthora nicotianae P1569]|uniref:PiggyBac transposable element-derived protein domain-containing protein n=1 Tax=Phytophthora nicotianae P1569 TaxID=1317065 RepID=V9DT45_PHYNI|nr:hypothetical protein F443_22847 [Phytophthora nicotianae P1569]
MASDEESESCSQNGTPVPGDSEVQRNLEADFEGVVNAGDGGDAGRDIQANQGTLATHRPQPIDEETKETEPPGNTRNTDTLRDPNIITADEGLGEYAAFDSDGGCEGDSVYDDDDELDWVEPNPDSEEENDSPTDIHFTPDLLATVGGVDVVARGAVPEAALDAMRDSGWTEPQLCTPYPYMDEPYEMRPDEWIREDYPGIYEGDHGPTAGALNAASTVLGAFLRLVTPQLLERVARETNSYFYENLDARVESQYVKQQARKKKKPRFSIQTPQEIKEILQRTPDVSGRELCIFIGLLIARTIAPNKEKFAHHWKTTDEGAIPRGCFGQFMKRDRFDHISRNLHFSSNSDRRATTDRAWKLRPVIDVLQETFQHNFIPPAVMAFDEAMLPSMSPFNKMRVFMRDKPHRWGTKLFMLCCSSSAYCIRFEVYCGKKEMSDGTTPPDTKSGPAAVVRNLHHVFGASGPSDFRLVVTDRFYTSVVLAMQLLAMKCYSVGTVMPNRKALTKSIIPPKRGSKPTKKRPENIERGTFQIVELKQVPSIKYACWWDNQCVFVLASGGSAEVDRTVRREISTGEQTEVMCPRFVKDYQSFMGGVDVHDQLRLQRYSLQLARRYKKYYKSLFLGLLDLAIVNAFIIYNARRTSEGKSKTSHVVFLKQLHLELCQLRPDDWNQLLRNQGLQPIPTKTNREQPAHVPIQTDEWRKGNGSETRKRRQRACKVCSVLKRADQSRGGETIFYCAVCKLNASSTHVLASRVFLCNKVKHTSNGIATSCFEIWHKHWKYGTMIPQVQRKRKLRARKPARVHDVGESDEGSSEAESNDESAAGSPSQTRQRTDD